MKSAHTAVTAQTLYGQKPSLWNLDYTFLFAADGGSLSSLTPTPTNLQKHDVRNPYCASWDIMVIQGHARSLISVLIKRSYATVCFVTGHVIK